MTSELEQKFYDTFGIEPLRHVCYRGFDNCIDNDYNCHCHNKKPCKDSHAIYPEITAEKLLEMICIYNSTYTNGYTNYSLLNERNVEKLKEQILKNCLIVRDDIKLQIQQLFKEEQ